MLDLTPGMALRQYPVLIGLCLLLSALGYSQQPITLEGQIFIVVDGTREFGEVGIDPSNNAIKFNILNPDIGAELHVLAFNRADRFLYGFDYTTGVLHRIDANGDREAVGEISVSQAYAWLAGDITADGRYLTMIGSDNTADQVLVQVDLQTAGFPFTSQPLPGVTNLADITYHPVTGLLYGFDAEVNQLVRIVPTNGTITAISAMNGENTVQGLYTDAFGELRGFGTSNSGVVGAIYKMSEDHFGERRLATGPAYKIQDLACAHYTVGFQTGVDPLLSFPCTDVVYTYRLGNTTDEVFGNTRVTHELPEGLEFTQVLQNGFGANVEINGDRLTIDNLDIEQGIRTLTVKVAVGDIAGGTYDSQAILEGLPAILGNDRVSDDPATIRHNDPTKLIINRIDRDSFFVDVFICHGDTAFLDGTAYGTQFNWSHGSSAPVVYAVESNQYVLEARSGCQVTTVLFDVTAASCPFTIEIDHDMIPREAYPCSDVVCRFIIDNDTGEDYSEIEFTDTLPEGLSLVDVLYNPFGGELVAQSDPHLIWITGMTVPPGVDTLDVLVNVGNVVPGIYLNQARISNFPQAIGMTRISDDPSTLEFDATGLTVLGVEGDTLRTEAFICDGTDIVLDGTPYGYEFLWDDGSTGATIEVAEPGIRSLTVFDGCESTYIIFDVLRGDPVNISFATDVLAIDLGDSVMLDPYLVNFGDTLAIQWTDPLESSLSCTTCLTTQAGPLSSVSYKVYVANAVCSDSAEIRILVDKSRKLFAANIFSPNGDGVNDYFFIQSPQFAEIEHFAVYDRWNNCVYRTTGHEVNDELSGWDGTSSGQVLMPATYVWHARITFLDGITQDFGGQVVLLR